MKKKISFIIPAFLLLFAFALASLTGCSGGYRTAEAYDADYAIGYNDGYNSSPSKTGGYAYKDEYEAPETAAADYSSTKPESTETDAIYERKIIKTVSLEMQTLDFEKTTASLEARVKAIGGYIESSYVTGIEIGSRGTDRRTANYTFRVPADKVDDFADAVSEEVNVTSRQENSRDVSDSYYDLQAHIETLTIREERLLEMLKEAKELQYLLELERELANVRYEIESLTSQVKRYDSLVSLSTVNVTLYEVVKYEEVIEQPKTFGEEVGNAFTGMWDSFVEGCRDFVIWLIYAIPTLVILAVLVVVVNLIVKNKYGQLLYMIDSPNTD